MEPAGAQDERPHSKSDKKATKTYCLSDMNCDRGTGQDPNGSLVDRNVDAITARIPVVLIASFNIVSQDFYRDVVGLLKEGRARDVSFPWGAFEGIGKNARRWLS